MCCLRRCCLRRCLRVLRSVSMFPQPHYNITIIRDIVKQCLRYRNANENHNAEHANENHNAERGTMNAKLTHFNEQGAANMVDLGNKESTQRKAVAEGRIAMAGATLKMIRRGGHKKGDVLAIARIAGIMAAKRTAELVPLCHPIMLTGINIEFDIDAENPGVICTATAKTTERTGVEMEALTAVQIALLTIYDMCKAVDRGMQMQAIRLVHKSGGKSGD